MSKAKTVKFCPSKEAQTKATLINQQVKHSPHKMHALYQEHKYQD